MSKAAAEAAFEDARKLVAAGRFAEACPKFAESNRLDPGIGVLLYLADCYERNGQTASAWATFREGMDAARSAGQAERERAARERVAALEPRLVRIVIVVAEANDAPGLEVRQGGEVVGRALWSSPIPVDPGTRKIDVTAPGKRRWSSAVEVSAKEPLVTINVPALEDEPVVGPKSALAAGPPPVVAATSSFGARKTAALIAAGVGVVGVGVGSAFGAMALSTWSGVKGDCQASGVRQARRLSARRAGPQERRADERHGLHHRLRRRRRGARRWSFSVVDRAEAPGARGARARARDLHRRVRRRPAREVALKRWTSALAAAAALASAYGCAAIVGFEDVEVGAAGGAGPSTTTSSGGGTAASGLGGSDTTSSSSASTSTGGASTTAAGGASSSTASAGVGGGSAAGGSGGGAIVDPPSCQGLARTCGADGLQDCCARGDVQSGTFLRSYDGVTPYTDMSYPATISPVVLDKYKVTVGRFRAFVQDVVTNHWQPSAGSGLHSNVPGGMIAGETGWDPGYPALPTDQSTWDQNLTTNCNVDTYQWSSNPLGNDEHAIICLTWFEELAFCIWDHGFLPKEEERYFAGSGGADQRYYPWSSPASSTSISDLDASYQNLISGGFLVVGSFPAGDGKFHHADLGGTAWEWLLDCDVEPYATMSCSDCAAVSTVCNPRAIRSGDFGSMPDALRAATRDGTDPSLRADYMSVRCARSP